MNFVDQLKTKMRELAEQFKASKFADVKAKDGSILRYMGETPEVGMPINVITEQGEAPAPDGEYILEDGSTLVVKEGVIAEVRPAEATNEEDMNIETQAAPAQATSTQTAAPTPKTVVESIISEYRFAEQIEDLKKEIASLKEANEALKAENAKDKETFSANEKFVKDLFALVEKIGATPEKVERKRAGIFAETKEENTPWAKELEEARKLLGKE